MNSNHLDVNLNTNPLTTVLSGVAPAANVNVGKFNSNKQSSSLNSDCQALFTCGTEISRVNAEMISLIAHVLAARNLRVSCLLRALWPNLGYSPVHSKSAAKKSGIISRVSRLNYRGARTAIALGVPNCFRTVRLLPE